MKFPHPTVNEALLEHSFPTDDDLGRDISKYLSV